MDKNILVTLTHLRNGRIRDYLMTGEEAQILEETLEDSDNIDVTTIPLSSAKKTDSQQVLEEWKDADSWEPIREEW